MVDEARQAGLLLVGQQQRPRRDCRARDIADMAAQAGDTDASEWLDLLWQAHDHVGDGDRTQALAALTRLRDRLAETERGRSRHSPSM